MKNKFVKSGNSKAFTDIQTSTYLFKDNSNTIFTPSNSKEYLNTHIYLKEQKTYLLFASSHKNDKYIKRINERAKNQTTEQIKHKISKHLKSPVYEYKNINNLKHNYQKVINFKTNGFFDRQHGNKLIDLYGNETNNFVRRLPVKYSDFINTEHTSSYATDIDNLIGYLYKINNTIIHHLDLITQPETLNNIDNEDFEIQDYSGGDVNDKTFKDTLKTQNNKIKEYLMILINNNFVNQKYINAVNEYINLIDNIKLNKEWYKRFMDYYKNNYNKFSFNIETQLSQKELNKRKNNYFNQIREEN